MNAESFSDTVLERATREQFGLGFDVDTVLVRDVDVARSAKATVYLTKKKQLFCYIHGASKLNLGDIRKIISRMGLKAELYLPPKGQPTYFDDIASKQFRSVFPGRQPVADEDLAYYRTLAAYNPALVLIQEVRDGHIYQFDPDARTHWRVATKFAYRRIRTS